MMIMKKIMMLKKMLLSDNSGYGNSGMGMQGWGNSGMGMQGFGGNNWFKKMMFNNMMSGFGMGNQNSDWGYNSGMDMDSQRGDWDSSSEDNYGRGFNRNWF